MQFQSHYNRFRLSLEGTKNKYVSFCKNIISFCAPRTFRFADYNILTVLVFAGRAMLYVTDWPCSSWHNLIV